MKTQLISFTALLICALSFFPSEARATLVPIAITAEVTYLDDDDGLLEGNINVGDIITGVYIYDTSTPESEPPESDGIYRHYAPPAGITLTISGLVFMTDPADVDFAVIIANDIPQGMVGSGLSDGYSLRSEHNLPLPNGAWVMHIQLGLVDPSYSALSSDVLPTTAPILDDWMESDEDIYISGGYPRGPSFRIKGDLISAVLIPEPATVILVGLGSLALLIKHKHRRTEHI